MDERDAELVRPLAHTPLFVITYDRNDFGVQRPASHGFNQIFESRTSVVLSAGRKNNDLWLHHLNTITRRMGSCSPSAKTSIEARKKATAAGKKVRVIDG